MKCSECGNVLCNHPENPDGFGLEFLMCENCKKVLTKEEAEKWFWIEVGSKRRNEK